MRSQVLYWAAQVYSTWHMVHSVQYNKKSQEKKKQGGEKAEEEVEEHYRQAADTSCDWRPPVDMLSLGSNSG